MKYYRHITCWENDRRARRLAEFREDIVTYFNSQNSGADEAANKARQRINLSMREVGGMVRAAGVAATIVWTPPPAVGGFVSEVAIFENVFNLKRFDISPQWVIDYLDRSTGVYASDYNTSVRRTLNPFWWMGQFLMWFAHLPFALMGAAGFNSARIEGSVGGRLLKLVVGAVPVVASALVIVDLLGWLDVFKSMFGN